MIGLKRRLIQKVDELNDLLDLINNEDEELYDRLDLSDFHDDVMFTLREIKHDIEAATAIKASSAITVDSILAQATGFLDSLDAADDRVFEALDADNVYKAVDEFVTDNEALINK